MIISLAKTGYGFSEKIGAGRYLLPVEFVPFGAAGAAEAGGALPASAPFAAPSLPGSGGGQGPIQNSTPSLLR
jgi:hypothetical protein